MDIAAMSMKLSEMQLKQDVGTSLLKQAMDSSQIHTEELTKIMEVSQRDLELAMSPHLGSNIDIIV